MKHVFSPGCALLLYRPELAARMLHLLRGDFPGIEEHTICCRHEPMLPEGTVVINTCPGCDRRYRELYRGITTLSFWEWLAGRGDLTLPDYRQRRMAILDACPTRGRDEVHGAVRGLLGRLGIELVEPERTGNQGTCCGDSFYGELPVAEVKERMRARASEMPAAEVVVYCVSCIKAMHLGGRRPRYLVDLLFGAETEPGICEPDRWHAALDAFIATH